MARINLEGLRTRDIRHGPGFQFQNAVVVNADNYALNADAPPMIFLNPAGAVDLLMPESTLIRRGLVFIFVNLSANIVTLKTNVDAAFTTAITVAANGGQRVVCTGDTSQPVGWRVW